MTANEKAAFITAQTQMMINERCFLEAENLERSRKGEAPANGPAQWAAFLAQWEPILGYNALIAFFRG